MSEDNRRKSTCDAPIEGFHCNLADDSADRAVKKTFAILGVDIDHPEQVAQFQDDLRFGRRLRKAADHAIYGFIGILVVAVGYALWEGIKAKVHGG